MNNFMFGGGFEIIFFLIFGIVICTFIVSMFRGIALWSSNNSKPKETKSVNVVSKRTHNWSSHSGTGTHHHSRSRTSYYVTFEFENGDRIELHVSGEKYGEMVEGDIGMLTYQGTRFHDFERSRW
ncbi:DUF2500 domain-containing protein [Clostridium sp. 'deep sea']|uniref:DUF2500 domain-containing protein n=1 Tax=Clostridium sp. 'deep sea' TaxID=2779445 RepID=UPI00325FAB35